MVLQPISVAAPPKAWVCDRSLAGIAGSNPIKGMDVRLLCSLCVIGGGLCDEIIARPEESYRLWCVVACDLESDRFLRQ